MGPIFIVLGLTGAGKSVQAGRLAARLGGVHLSSGELLRHDPRLRRQLAEGELVDSNLVDQVVAKAVADVPRDQAVIMDGFPREMSEVRWLESKLESWDRPIGRVVLLQIDEQTASQRLAGRGREDDTPEALREKYAEYHAVTQRVVDYYRQ
ncbi:MAG TPA: nucleoside monophosphate kinase, partial [Candidatus Saccharimonas sp.]|nr:nucleoside monophosphate kinase [Candidatus Saccharimonas sp.]